VGTAIFIPVTNPVERLNVGQHVMLAVVHQRGELGPAAAQLVGDMPPGLLRGLGIRLQEGLAGWTRL
jgi:hypothetical protein